MHVDITQPIWGKVWRDHDVQDERCPTFMFNLEYNDNMLKDFGQLATKRSAKKKYTRLQLFQLLC